MLSKMWVWESYRGWQLIFQIIIRGSVFNTLCPLGAFVQPSSASHSERLYLTLLQSSNTFLLPVSNTTTNAVFTSSLSFWKCRNVVFSIHCNCCFYFSLLLHHIRIFQPILPVFWCVLASAFLDANCSLGIQFPHFYFYIKNKGG